MKKIGILTFINPDNKNYGAILQAFALSKAINSLGYEAELIDLRSTIEKSSIKARAKKIVREVLEGNPFRSFLRRHVSISRPIFSNSELQKQAENYFAVIVGSDQVWRPEYCGPNAMNYFLDFVPDGVRRISYAASFGKATWEYGDQQTANIKKEILKFESISVREESGVKICKDVFGVEAKHVLDPTLLVEPEVFHDVISNIQQKRNHIASFVLDRNGETSAIENFIASKTCKPVFDFNKKQTGFLKMRWNKYQSVKSWLSGIRDADLVITDSFHCVCFSIIFQKQFICIANKERGLTRLESLLTQFNIENRIVSSLYQLKKCGTLELGIDYTQVFNILSDRKRESMHFFKTALK